EEQHRAVLRRDLPRAFEETWNPARAPDGLHHDGSELVPPGLDDLPEGVQVPVREGVSGAGEPTRDTLWIEPGQQVALEVIASGEVHREVPVVPAVVATEGNLVPSGRGPGDAHRLGHHLAASAGVADHVRPGVELEQQLSEGDVLGRV